MVDVNAYEGQELAYTGEAITSTTKKTNWGVNVWRQWAAKNGEARPLETISFTCLNKLLCRFYAEICKVSGEPYEAECLRLMRKSIERYLQENTIGEVSLKRDPTFRESNLVLKQRMRALMLRGNRKQQLVQINISTKEEELLWKSGQLGNQSALALLNVNLLNLVKRMGIKGRKDLYMLRVEDFEVREDEQNSCHVICTKPSAGGTENLRSMVASPTDGERCPVVLFREFLRHRPKHMRGIGPLFLALSNFTTDADVWYRPVRLSEATLGSIIRQMANAARTMGLSGVQNSGGTNVDVKSMVSNLSHELENSPQNKQNIMNSHNQGCAANKRRKFNTDPHPPQVMGNYSTETFDENNYLSSADASILAQYYGDKGYPPTMVRSNIVDMKLTQDNILQNLATSISNSLSSHNNITPDTSQLNLAAVATSLANLQNSSLIQGPQIMIAQPIQQSQQHQLQHTQLQHQRVQAATMSSPSLHCVQLPTSVPNVVIQSPQQHQQQQHQQHQQPTSHNVVLQSPTSHNSSPLSVHKSPSHCNTDVNVVSTSPLSSIQHTTTGNPGNPGNHGNTTTAPSDNIVQECTINVITGQNGGTNVKTEQMDYTEFISKCEENVEAGNPGNPRDTTTAALLHTNKIINTEIKDVMYVLKQGSSRFVNCTFNFNFHQ